MPKHCELENPDQLGCKDPFYPDTRMSQPFADYLLALPLLHHRRSAVRNLYGLNDRFALTAGDSGKSPHHQKRRPGDSRHDDANC